MKTSGNHNLIINIVAPDIATIDEFINKQVRSEPGIKHVEVNLGNVTIVPEYAPMKLFYSSDSEYAPCGWRFDDEMRCSNCPAFWREKYEE